MINRHTSRSTVTVTSPGQVSLADGPRRLTSQVAFADPLHLPIATCSFSVFFSTETQDRPESFNNRTESFHNDPGAYYSFSYTGTTFKVYGVQTTARGGFMARVDAGDWLNVGHGHSDEQAESATGQVVEMLASPNLAHGQHEVCRWL